MVSGVEVVAKPDPEVRARFGERAGRPLAGAVFVDDSPRNMAAGRAAGLDAVLFTSAVQLRAVLRERGLPVHPAG